MDSSTRVSRATIKAMSLLSVKFGSRVVRATVEVVRLVFTTLALSGKM